MPFLGEAEGGLPHLTSPPTQDAPTSTERQAASEPKEHEPNPPSLNAPSPSQNAPTSAKRQEAPEPNPPPSFSLAAVSEPIPNPPPSPTKNPPSSSKKKDASEPKGPEARGKDHIVPKMVMTYEKIPSVTMKKWMSRLSKRIETHTSSEKGVKKSGYSKTIIRKPTKED